MSDDLADLLRELADEVDGDEKPDDDNLPEFRTYNGDIGPFQMSEEVAQVRHLTVYRDVDGDAWVADSDGVAACMKPDLSGGTLLDAVEEAQIDE